MQNKVIKFLKVFTIIAVLLLLIFIGINLIGKKMISTSDSLYESLAKREDIYLKINDDSVTNTSLTYRIYNNTNQELYYGVDYEIEFNKDNTWKKYNVQASWIDIAVMLKSNSYNEERATWETIYGKLSKGKYRIIKNINNIIVFDEFEIKN